MKRIFFYAYIVLNSIYIHTSGPMSKIVESYKQQAQQPLQQFSQPSQLPMPQPSQQQPQQRSSQPSTQKPLTIRQIAHIKNAIKLLELTPNETIEEAYSVDRPTLSPEKTKKLDEAYELLYQHRLHGLTEKKLLKKLERLQQKAQLQHSQKKVLFSTEQPTTIEYEIDRGPSEHKPIFTKTVSRITTPQQFQLIDNKTQEQQYVSQEWDAKVPYEIFLENLLRFEPNILIDNEQIQYQLLLAIKNHNYYEITRILPELNTYSYLHIALMLEDLKYVNELINRDIPNSQRRNILNKQGGKYLQTPLHIAVQKNLDLNELSPDIVNDTDLLIWDANGDNPLMIAIKNNNFDNAAKILSHPVFDDPLEKMKVINYINYKDDESSTTHIAAKYNDDPRILDLLIQKGFPLDIENKKGKTPLHIAVEKNNLKMVQRLLEAGVDQNITDEDILTPLQLAKKLGHNYIAHYLSASQATSSKEKTFPVNEEEWKKYFKNPTAYTATLAKTETPW